MRCLSPNLRAGSREGERKRSAGSSLEARTQRPAWEPGLPIGTPAHKLDPCTSTAELPILEPLHKYCITVEPLHISWPPVQVLQSCPLESLHKNCITVESLPAFWKPCKYPAMWQREDLLDIWREQTKQSRGLNILVGCAGQL